MIYKHKLILLSILFLGVIFIYAPITSLAFSLGLTLLASIIIKPKIGVYLSIITLPGSVIFFQYFSYLKDGLVRIPLYYIIVTVTFIVWMFSKSINDNSQKNLPVNKSTSQLITISIFFVAWAIITFFWSINVHEGIPIIQELVSGLMIVLIMKDFIKTKRDIQNLVILLIIVGLLYGTITFISKWFQIKKSYLIYKDIEFFIMIISEKGRAAGFTGVNNAATIINIFILISLSYFTTKMRAAKTLLIFVIIFLMTATIMTGSKSGFVGLLISLFLLNISLPQIRGKRIKYGTTIISMLLIAFFIATIITTGDISKTRAINLDASFSYTTRLEWWSAGFKELFNSYGLGLGIGGLRKVIEPILFAHNIYLSTLFDLGVIGLGMLLLLLIYLFGHFINAIKECYDKQLEIILFCAIAATVGFLMNDLLQGDYYNCSFWLLLGIDLSIINVIYGISDKKRGIVNCH